LMYSSYRARSLGVSSSSLARRKDVDASLHGRVYRELNNPLRRFGVEAPAQRL
jgi:hypothetical protein